MLGEGECGLPILVMGGGEVAYLREVLAMLGERVGCITFIIDGHVC
jgi:hypothetical protein